MFLQLFKYKLLSCLRSKHELFWTLLFPILLGTFFYIAFHGIQEKTENFEIIPIAVVMDDSSAYAGSFKNIAGYIDINKQYDNQNNIIPSTGTQETTDSLFDITYTSDKQAKQMLQNEDVDGIIYISQDISVTISKNGLNQTVIKSFTDNFLQKYATIANIAVKNPEAVQKAVSSLTKEVSFNKNLKLTDGDIDAMLQYYYALIAMGCLFGCSQGFYLSIKLKANLSSLGARRCMAPINRLKVLLADLLAVFLIHCSSQLLLLFYLNFILKINFGKNIGYIILTIIVGSVIGISYGIFIGSLKKIPEGLRESITMLSSLLMCFFSGLMISSMQNIIEHTVPIVNKINPAALITDCLYSLNVYETHERFFGNLIIMLMIAAILCLLSFFATRREYYDSL